MHVPVADSVARRVLSVIADEGLEPGARLPSERALARRFGVARTGVREALRSLADARVIRIRPGRGTYVIGFTPDQLSPRLLAVGLPLDWQATWEALELRHVLEVAVAELAAQRATPDQLEDLARNLADMRTAVASEADTLQLEFEFHDGLAAAAGNRQARSLLASMSTLLRRSREIALGSPRGPHKALAFHEAIFGAVREHSPRDARRAMEQHLDDVEIVLRQSSEGHPA
jgi:GntR family transcriptional repressor for pyruvate dehydrogenase complex